jgi:hypothetical protein
MRGDKRKARRHRLRRDAWVMLDAGQRCECVITNISDRGAHISIADSDALPDSFVCWPKRRNAPPCRIIWRKPREIGIKFESWLDDRIRAGVKPNTDAGVATKENKEAEKV